MTIEQVFKGNLDIPSTIHKTALIVVTDSGTMPYKYYRYSVTKSSELFNTLKRIGNLVGNYLKINLDTVYILTDCELTTAFEKVYR